MAYHEYEDATGKCRHCGESRADWDAPCAPKKIQLQFRKEYYKLDFTSILDVDLSETVEIISEIEDEILTQWSREIAREWNEAILKEITTEAERNRNLRSR